jgi:hypothetical protein
MMEIYISKKYLAFLSVLWIAPTIAAIWGAAIWVTISLLAFFLIYAGHEWLHVWVCRINNVDVHEVVFDTRGKTHILFDEANGPDKNKTEADIFLAGVVWDSILFTIAILCSMVYGLYMKDPLPMIFSMAMVFITYMNLKAPNSDWSNYQARIKTEQPAQPTN